MRRTPRTSASWTAALLGLAGALCPAAAGAQSTEITSRLRLRAEGGLGTMLSDDQQTVQGYGLALQGSLRPAVRVLDWLSGELTVSGWTFPTEAGAGQQTMLGLGPRFEPEVVPGIRPWGDVHAGVGITGEHSRFMLDVGVGLEIAALPWLGVGPAVRYAQLFATGNDVSSAQSWSAGLAVTLRLPDASAAPPREPAEASPASVASTPLPSDPPPPPPPPDGDNDGVPDAEDRCAEQAAGTRPDPERAGCPLDTDGDGVIDEQDTCPAATTGARPDPERAGCPARDDDDGDGVVNDEDHCRTQAAGAQPDPQRPGCPLLDRDHDWVLDSVDHCPDQPGAPHPSPLRNGCPGLVRIEGDRIVLARPIAFTPNTPALLPTSAPVLQALLAALTATPEIRRVVIEAHTSDAGPAAHNMALSRQRARAVQQWLVAHGTFVAQLEPQGFGESRPLPAGGAASERVEIRIVDPPPVTPAPAPASTPAPAPAPGGNAAP